MDDLYNSDNSTYTQGNSLADLILDNNLAILNAQSTAVVSGLFPWQQNPVDSTFFPFVDIDGRRWDQLFPYRLLVIDVTQQNRIVNGSDPSSLKVNVYKGTGTALLDFTNFNSQWVFELPISPQQMSITDQYAIQTSATLLGVLEEHSGLRFKMINLQGTMGVWPQRTSVVAPPASPSIAQSLFGGTIAAFGNVVSSITNTINSATGASPANKPVTKRPEDVPNGLISTGYWNAMKLQQFIEQYAEGKKDPKNAGWRLVFDIPKQGQSFVVTPIQYTWQQNASKAMEIGYSLQLKAWRRIDLNQRPAVAPPNVQTITPGILQRIQNTIFDARVACSAALNLIGAVTSDVEAPLAVLQQTSLFVKDLAGAVITAADLPFQLQTDYKNAIASFFTSLSINNLVGSASVNPAITTAIQKIQNSAATKEGLSLDAVSSGQLGNTAAQNQSIDPSLNVFSQPAANFQLMDQAPINSLTLTTAQQNAVNQVLTDARNLTVDDLKQFRAQIQTLAMQISNNYGAGNAFVSQVYSLPAPAVLVTPMTVDDYDILKTLYDVMQSYDILTATTQVDDNNTQTSMEYVAGLAASADIDFQISASKFLAPVPFGLTIEAISGRYLGDPQRWIEIATLNNLRDPYIDENGFQYPLLSNATGRQITISQDTNLYLGQRVLLYSATQVPSARTILNIDQLSDTSFLVTLDGQPNLNNFITNDRAYLQAYLPGTVNSQQKIYIPSNLPVSDLPNIIIPSVAAQDPLSAISQVDLLLTDSGDLAVNNFGDFRLSYGLTNIIQSLKIKFGTVKGSVLLHPEFGVGVQPGSMTSQVQVTDLFNSINEMIQQDARFSGVKKLQITLQGPLLSINLAVGIAGSTGIFPIAFQLVPPQ